MAKISSKSSPLPVHLRPVAQRLENEPSSANHRELALGAKAHLAEQNVDSYVTNTPHGSFVVIKDEPLDESQPEHQLTALAQNLRKQGVALNLFTAYYLSGMAGFMSMKLEELNDAMSLGLSWKDLAAGDELSSELDHELRHVEQHNIRTEARQSGEENPFPEIRVKHLDPSQALSPWVAKHYNGKYGHTIDEHDAYLHQAGVELERARADAADSAEVTKHANKALDLSVRSGLFALNDAQALTLKDPQFSWDKPDWEDLRGDISVRDGGVQIWVDSRDLGPDELLDGIGREVKKLKAGEKQARARALEALALMPDPELKAAWSKELQGLGWVAPN